MSVYKSKASPFYQYDFQINGHRFHGTTKARNRRDAQAVERDAREKAKKEVQQLRKTGSLPLTIDLAVGRYWIEKGQYRKNKQSHFLVLSRLVSHFGKDTRLDAIDDAAIVTLIAERRRQFRWGKAKLKHAEVKTITAATINRETLVPLKAIFRRARTVWHQHLPDEPQWKEHILKEPKERVRELLAHEQRALDASIREDYLPWFNFMQESGRRLRETLIRWSNVNWEARQIVTVGKGDVQVWTPITDSIRQILQQCVGHHPEFVFTFVAQRTQNGKVKGMRYPLTVHGTQSRWRRALASSGVTNFRMHDNRHDTATKLLRRTKNLKLVQRVLNHADVTTTAKYAHVMDEEVAEALQDYAESRKNSRSVGEIDR
ncbi:tyrosine-type recombinase/integrase [Rhizobium leguminosarum]|uniref:tyrosine-type recombinase/integrase n=1 Tax=Rhizobium leguminosarum TaxID=384 RepID=UPI003F9A7847